MLAAAVVTIDLHGKSTAEELLPVFEDFLENAPADRKYDDARQSVVVLMGSLAKHLDPNDPKVSQIIENPRFFFASADFFLSRIMEYPRHWKYHLFFDIISYHIICQKNDIISFISYR
jgi:hypothetical protein